MSISGLGFSARNRLNSEQLKKTAGRVEKMIIRNKTETELKSLNLSGNPKLRDLCKNQSPKLKDFVG